MYTSSSSVSGCSSILNTFTCCSVKPLCNTTGGCPSGQYWCHLMESCLPVTSPCSPYHTSADGHIFTLPPRYTAMTPFYHMVADIALEIPPVSEPVHINVSRHAWQNTLFKAGVYSVTWNSSAETFIKAVMTILMSQWFSCICWHMFIGIKLVITIFTSLSFHYVSHINILLHVKRQRKTHCILGSDTKYITLSLQSHHIIINIL